ncbi:predicted protein [Nematostella vectensis]|uniref:G-protein coupled receptors family 1 profile domain-containing protein n=1 Tax=Nematostella vectensis TaxID=45351 RepID=A7SYU2_NEMVE|nr:predicted protein [Nematostella vectensis]|eukprot:XP_001623222.1 predicted protein [Nematostella vectensis]
MNEKSASNITFGCLFISTSLDYVPFVRKAIIASCFVNGIMSVVAVLGNAIVLLTIYKTSSLHTPPNYLLFMMAIADCGVGLLAQPSSIVRNAIALRLKGPDGTDPSKALTDAFCVSGVASEIFGAFFVYFSLLCLTAISFERYLAIRLHLRYTQVVTLSRTLFLSAPILLVALAIVTGRLLSEGFGTSYSILIVFGSLVFFACLAVIALCNIKIALALRRHTVQISSQTAQDMRTVLVMAKFRKSVVTMLLVFVLFLTCFLPYGCVGLVQMRLGGMTHQLYVAAFSTFPVLYLNSCLNPALFCWRMKEIRRAAKSVIKGYCSNSL